MSKNNFDSIMKNLKKEAKKKALYSSYEYSCPNCKNSFKVSVGKNTCPSCGQIINLKPDSSWNKL